MKNELTLSNILSIGAKTRVNSGTTYGSKTATIDSSQHLSGRILLEFKSQALGLRNFAKPYGNYNRYGENIYLFFQK